MDRYRLYLFSVIQAAAWVRSYSIASSSSSEFMRAADLVGG